MIMRRHPSLTFAAVVVLLCGIAGSLFGRSALVAQDQIAEQYRVLAAALGAVEEHYVGEVESDRLIYGALRGMMQTLDPHSSVMDPRSYAQTRERQEGRYYGIGVSILSVNGDVRIVNVTENAPAHEAGLRRGDVIARVAGDDAKGWTTEQVSTRLKGAKGTRVDISIRRAGYEQPIDLQVRRDEVRLRTVTAAMLDATTGYIKLSEFTDTSNDELGAAVRDLTGRGMRRLVFDLRDNPGGVLPQAILIANRFLRRGQLIVYTRGRSSEAAEDYRAERDGDLTMPMITLVNRNSASASEIVSGALQDHDRSLVVGETTFGKALVQSVFRVSHGAAAAITTARYYTPSGRLIQRPWDSSFDEYFTYTSRDQGANADHANDQLKLTDAGRKVYGGGGIEPDRRFAGQFDGFDPTPFSRAVAARDLFEAYARRFTRAGDARIPPSATTPRRELADNYEVTDAMLAEFREMVAKSPMTFDEAGWNTDRDFIEAMIQKEIDLDLFGASAAYRNLAKRDPQMRFALTLFAEAQQLLDSRPAPAARAGL
jgi:carboxyl-terminal processing protease